VISVSCFLHCEEAVVHIQRQFLPRRPGVFAYAAWALMEIYSLMLPQRKRAEQSRRLFCMKQVYPSGRRIVK
jgi:hypothetical protein